MRVGGREKGDGPVMRTTFPFSRFEGASHAEDESGEQEGDDASAAVALSRVSAKSSAED